MNMGKGIERRVGYGAEIVTIQVRITIFGDCLLRDQLLCIIRSIQERHQILITGCPREVFTWFCIWKKQKQSRTKRLTYKDLIKADNLLLDVFLNSLQLYNVIIINCARLTLRHLGGEVCVYF